MSPKTREEIEKLKANWKSDPCFQIAFVPGFEEHLEELLAFEDEMETKWASARELDRQETREQTGVVQETVLSALYTFMQIEQQVQNQDRYITELPTADHVKVELMQAQIRATLLQAAQLKRIADVLEKMDDGDTLARSVSIRGSK